MPHFVEVPPESLVQNLAQLLRKAANESPDHGLSFYLPGKLDEVGMRLTYPDFLRRAEENAERLHHLDLRPGSIILLHFNSHLENLVWFWAVILAGFTPTMSTPFSNNAEQRRKHIVYLDLILEKPLCLTTRSLMPEFAAQDNMRIQLIEEMPPDLSAQNGVLHRNGLYFPVDQGVFKTRSDIAVLMLTSGSTGNAKVVCLSHDMVLSAISGKSDTLQTRPGETFFNWIGADHVACLTEIHLHGMMVGAEQVYAQAVDIVPNPLEFLNIIQIHGVTHSFAPNFFLAGVRRALEDSDSVKFRSKLNLTSLKRIVTGGEANVVESCAALSNLFKQYGASDAVLIPAFGMTETCGGSIYNNDFPQHDLTHQYEFSSVGQCVRQTQVRIVDNDGNEVQQGKIGSVELRGSNVFQRYYRNEEATEESFRGDWFVTGDLGSIDDTGMLNLGGRAKETLIINGVNYAPQDIEAVLENVEGTKTSFTVAFPYRPKNSPTEGLCIVYLPTSDPEDYEARGETNDAIVKAAMLQSGVRPLVIPLDKKMLQKSTLGKLSRTKIKKAYDNGEYNSYHEANQMTMTRLRAEKFEPPTTEAEELVLKIFSEVLNVSSGEIGVNTNLYDFGINSIGIIKIKTRLEKLVSAEVPMVTIITNLTIRGLTSALRNIKKPSKYNPMVVLQEKGSGTPLWLIHPGVGEVLIFMPLASHINNRPVFAMRASGFEKGEKYITSIDDCVNTYYQKIRSVQPHGPYAIAGYSYGSMLAFEIAKRLNANGEEVPFLGSLNLPPHIKFRMRQLDWTNCLLHLSYFLDLFSEEWAHSMHPVLRTQDRDAVIAQVVAKAPPARMAQLGLDTAKLTNWADLAFSLQNSAIDYEPSGLVTSMDVFCAVPLKEVAEDMDDWMENHLGKWKDFCREPPKFHRVDGAHYTMIGPTHVYSFQKILKTALRERGL